jgi:hypothetical protein
MKGWIDLCSDVSWADYGGLWAKPSRDGQTWVAVRFQNMVDLCGEREARECGYTYLAEVLVVEPRAVDSATLKAALDCCGMEGEGQPQAELVYALISYGCYATAESFRGEKYAARLRASARREAEALLLDGARRESKLDEPANAIGSSHRDMMTGNVLAGLARYQAGEGEASTEKDIMLKLYGAQPRAEKPTVRTIKQKDMTGECWLIQMYGTSACNNCECRTKPSQCGGLAIRETGENSKGKKVPL